MKIINTTKEVLFLLLIYYKFGVMQPIDTGFFLPFFFVA